MKNMIYICCITNIGSMEMYNTPKSQHTSGVITMYVNTKVSSATVVIIFHLSYKHYNTWKGSYEKQTAIQVLLHNR